MKTELRRAEKAEIIRANPNAAYRKFIKNEELDRQYSVYVQDFTPETGATTTSERKEVAKMALLGMLRDGLI